MLELTDPPRNPAPTPSRRSHSIRRTSTILMHWPDGFGTQLQLEGRARDLVLGQLREWDLSELAFPTELIISELITNAIRYAGGPVGVRRGEITGPNVFGSPVTQLVSRARVIARSVGCGRRRPTCSGLARSAPATITR